MYLWVCWNLIWDQCTELDPEHSEISRNGNNPVALTELWTKFLWPIFSLLCYSSPCKVKMTPVPGHASNPIKTADLIWLNNSESIKASTFAWATLLMQVPHLVPCKALRGATMADDNPGALHIIKIKLVNNAWVFWAFICMLDGYPNLAVRYDNLSYSSSQKTMSILFFFFF